MIASQVFPFYTWATKIRWSLASLNFMFLSHQPNACIVPNQMKSARHTSITLVVV